MAESGAVDGKRGLRLIRSPEAEKGKIVPVEEFFQANVLPMFKKMAAVVSGKDGSADYDVLEVSDRMEKELRRILVSRAIKPPKFSGRIEKSEWMEGKIAARLVQNYACYVLVMRDAEDMDLDEFAPGKNYYFEATQFEDDEEGDFSFEGKIYWQVRQHVEKKEGKNSEAAKNVRRVVKLIRDLLYKPALKEKKREALASELVELRLKVGEAARYIVADFIRDYDIDDGWVESLEIDDDDLGFVEDSQSYRKAIARLKVGGFDLRKLV